MPVSPATSTTYSPPGVLQPIEVLDHLELSGSTSAAAASLKMSQPTVSRRSRSLINDLALKQRPIKALQALRYGETPCLKLLRRASQCHRLEAGAWRLGGSPWQQPILRGLSPGGAVPMRFRHPLAWRELLEAHALDAALISGLDLRLAVAAERMDARDAAGGPLIWGSCLLQPLEQQRLGLLMPPGMAEPPREWQTVAVPRQQAAPGLASLVRQRQWQCLQAPRGCQEPDGWARWLQEMQRPLLASRAWSIAVGDHLKTWHWWPWPEAQGDRLWLLGLGEVWQEQATLQPLPALLAERIRRFDSSADS